MGNFKIGEKVIALTNPRDPNSQPRVKGQLYEVLDVLYCSKCGEQLINITTIQTHSPTFYCECGQRRIPNHNKYWTYSRFFAKPEELQSELDRAIEEENYEEAITIRDILGEQVKELIEVSPQT